MYDETAADGRRKYTVGVSRKTVYRHLEPSGGRRQPGKSARPAAPAEPLATLSHPIHARISEPAARPRTRPAAARAPLACPTCGREPATRHEAVQQREDLAIVWLHLDVTALPKPGTAWYASRTSPSSTSAAPAAATAP